MQKLCTLGAALLGALALTAAPAHAAFFQLTDPSQISTLGVFNIPDMGGANGKTVPGPVTATAAGNTATFTSTGNLFLFDASGGDTAFSDGTPLLETYDATPAGAATGPLNISFASGVKAFGLYGQGGAFTGTTSFTVTAFNGLTALGTFSTGPFDDSASVPDPTSTTGGFLSTGTSGFLGGLATGSDVITGVKIVSTSTQTAAGDNAIYGPVTVGRAVAVPESSSLALIGLGLLPLAALGLRARKRAPVPA